jgi:hypothetical protein
MNKFSLEQLFNSLRSIKLTSSEKSFMRLRVANYMNRHPIGSRASFLTFRYMAPVALALVLFLGTGGLVAFASQETLPGETLYPIKRVSEQIKKVTLRGSKERADYELALIDKRFTETNQLIAQQKLTIETEASLTTAIQEHTNDFKNDIAQLAQSDPAEALSYNAKLGSTLKTGTHIMLALADKQSAQNAKVSPNTLVLAAYATAEKISAEKKQLETIVLSDTSVATIKTAEKRYADTLAVLDAQHIIPTTKAPETLDTTAASTTPDSTVTAPVMAKTALMVETKSTTTDGARVSKRSKEQEVKPAIDSTDTSTAESTLSVSADAKPADLQTLANSMQAAYKAKQYRQVITIADQIDQIIHEAKKIKEAETTFNVNLSDTSEATTVDSSTDTETTPVVNTAASQVKSSTTPSTASSLKSN